MCMCVNQCTFTPSATPLIDQLDRTILRAMASGATDETVANLLATSPRTVRRRIAAITGHLQVQGRFALGLRLSGSAASGRSGCWT